uniref:Uncharacterized protein n=1 Tax=Romanomermis culicivorax TaxID=13658 RepID=A0A915J2F9_ROMCU
MLNAFKSKKNKNQLCRQNGIPKAFVKICMDIGGRFISRNLAKHFIKFTLVFRKNSILRDECLHNSTLPTILLYIYGIIMEMGVESLLRASKYKV